jgi:two-component system sensor histidine kinase/response regulator
MDNPLPALPGFDTAAAMKMLNNNAKLYGSVLKRFTKQYAASYPTLETTLKGTDWVLIQREAHTIKGLAGTIGHPGLQEAARALESCVKGVDAPDPAAILPLADAFLAALSSVLGTLKAAYPE